MNIHFLTIVSQHTIHSLTNDPSIEITVISAGTAIAIMITIFFGLAILVTNRGFIWTYLITPNRSILTML